MNLDEKRIKSYEDALRGPAPNWDPNWEVTESMFKLVTLQSKEIINLQSQLDALTYSHQSSMESLLFALQKTAGLRQQIKPALAPQEVAEAVNNLEHSAQAIANGQRVAEYAGTILKFIAKVII